MDKEVPKPIKVPDFSEEALPGVPVSVSKEKAKAKPEAGVRAREAGAGGAKRTRAGEGETKEAAGAEAGEKAEVRKAVATLERCPSGVPGLDAAMAGGFERGSVSLIGGTTGTGKSIFCMQFLINGIEQFGEAGVYISFEEQKKKFFRHMRNFGWDLEKYERKGKFVFLEYTPSQVKTLLQEGGGAMEASILKINAKRIVVDSLTAFTLLYQTELAKRQACLALFDLFSKWGCTVLLTSESASDLDKHWPNPFEFIVDGVILLYNTRKGDIRERSMEIIKLRGTRHITRLLPMKITSQGIVVFPEEAVF